MEHSHSQEANSRLANQEISHIFLETEGPILCSKGITRNSYLESDEPSQNRISLSCGLNSSVWGARLVASSCEHGFEPYGSTKGGEFLDSLSDYGLLENNCAQ